MTPHPNWSGIIWRALVVGAVWALTQTFIRRLLNPAVGWVGTEANRVYAQDAISGGLAVAVNTALVLQFISETTPR